ncbi:MAG: DUF58 domain-containing protein [Planctomycetes bacterium]|nr:DUF58 domain-containing protein [Planctomycetota bacterium]
MELFDSDFVKKLEYLSLVARRVFRGQLLALKRTRQLGAGIEFADHREYTAGDDFRYLDWNLYARHGELLLKRFEEEEDLHVYVMVDCSRSMQFGKPNKFDYARQVAAAISYVALADLDRVAMLGFSDGIVADLPLTRGKDRILSLLRFLEDAQPSGENTALERVAQEFIHRSQRRGIVVVISDLYDPAGFERGLDVLRYRNYDVHVVQVFDPAEANPDLLGDLELLDVESEDLHKVTVTEKHLAHYKRLFREFHEKLQSYCVNQGLGLTVASTRVPYDELLLGMMREGGVVR